MTLKRLGKIRVAPTSEMEVHAKLLRLIAKAMRANKPEMLEVTAEVLEEAAKR